MIDKVEKQIHEIASKFIFIEKKETLLKTPNTLKIKLSITPTCFIQIYQNIQKGVKNYVVVSGNQRLFGRDCDGGKWHSHPKRIPTAMVFPKMAQRRYLLKTFFTRLVKNWFSLESCKERGLSRGSNLYGLLKKPFLVIPNLS